MTDHQRQLARECVDAAIRWWGELGAFPARYPRLRRRIGLIAGRRELDPDWAERLRNVSSLAELHELREELFHGPADDGTPAAESAKRDS